MKIHKFSDAVIIDRFPKGDDFKSDVIYYHAIIGMVKFKCPCGCGNTEVLAIARSFDRINRFWEITIHEGKATIRASVGSAFPCKSHYFITENNVQGV